MKNRRRVDTCLNCKHCQMIDHWDYQEYNCLHESEPRPYKSEEYTEKEYEAELAWRDNHGVDGDMICDAWEKMK